jgi:hypothetical protein
VPLGRWSLFELRDEVLTTGLVDDVSTTTLWRWPYASAERVFWVVDNGSPHRGRASVDRLEGRWRNLRLIHLPVHASWLNQIETYFSIVQRKVLTPTTSWTLPKSNIVCWPSSTAMSRPPLPSTGAIKADLDRLLRRLTEHQRLGRLDENDWLAAAA